MWPLDVCWVLRQGTFSTFVLAHTDKIGLRLRLEVNRCDGLVSHLERVYDFHPISTTETRNKKTTHIGRRKYENINANTSNKLDNLFTEH